MYLIVELFMPSFVYFEHAQFPGFLTYVLSYIYNGYFYAANPIPNSSCLGQSISNDNKRDKRALQYSICGPRGLRSACAIAQADLDPRCPLFCRAYEDLSNPLLGTAVENVPSDISACNEDSNLPVHPRSLIRVFVAGMKKTVQPWLSKMRPEKILIRLRDSYDEHRNGCPIRL